MQWQGGKSEYRRVQVPAHRFTPLKARWLEIYEPLVKHMKLQVRMNLKTKSVELRVGKSPRVYNLKFQMCGIESHWPRFEILDLRIETLEYPLKHVLNFHGFESLFCVVR